MKTTKCMYISFASVAENSELKKCISATRKMIIYILDAIRSCVESVLQKKLSTATARIIAKEI